jgi:hypothetical protein
MKVVKGLELSAHWQGGQQRKTMLMENVNVMIS